MPSNIDFANQCVADITSKLTEVLVDKVDDKLFYVYDHDTFFDATKTLSFPCAGVIYEGIQTKDKGKAAGRGSMLSVAVVIIAGEKSREVKQMEDKAVITLMLDTIRKAIVGKQSPTGHKWEFILEVPAEFGDKQKGLGYFQRWGTTVIVQ